MQIRDRLFSALALLSLVALSHSALAATHNVSPAGFTWNPNLVNAQSGDTVTWTNMASIHTVQQTTAQGVCSNLGGGFFSGPAPVAGGTFTWNIPANFTGTVFYKCGPHCGSGMRGSIIVTAPPLPPCLGDANNDRVVQFDDVTVALANFGGPGPAGDADHDLDVDFADVIAVLNNFAVPCP